MATGTFVKGATYRNYTARRASQKGVTHGFFAQPALQSRVRVNHCYDASYALRSVGRVVYGGSLENY